MESELNRAAVLAKKNNEPMAVILTEFNRFEVWKETELDQDQGLYAIDVIGIAYPDGEIERH